MCSRSERGGGRGQVGYADVVGGMVGAGGKCSGQAGGLGGPPPLSLIKLNKFCIPSFVYLHFNKFCIPSFVYWTSPAMPLTPVPRIRAERAA